MKLGTFALAVWAVAALPAKAGDPAVVVEGAAAATVAMHDWSGGYAGLSYGRTAADIVFNSVSFSADLDDGRQVGIHAGYLFQRGNLVYGGELAYASVDGAKLEGGSGDDEWVKRLFDVKARVGYAANRALFYGVLGYSTANLIDENPPILERELDGFSAGIGAEFAVTDQMTVGLEYLTRSLSGDYANGGAGSTIDLGVDTMTLRVGLEF